METALFRLEREADRRRRRNESGFVPAAMMSGSGPR
jgi:hypothetical protein